MDSADFETIKILIQEAYASRDAAIAFESNCNRKCIVAPGFPILWFGDLDAFLKKSSNERAVTIGVNPSGKELTRHKSGGFIRFPDISATEVIDSRACIKAMNSYFRSGKYLAWFKKGMDTIPFNYEDGSLIHIDCCSTIATKPTWSGLCVSMQTRLKNDNKPIFEKLLLTLNPSTVFIASNKAEKAYIEQCCQRILKLGNSQISYIPKYKQQ